MFQQADEDVAPLGYSVCAGSDAICGIQQRNGCEAGRRGRDSMPRRERGYGVVVETLVHQLGLQRAVEQDAVLVVGGAREPAACHELSYECEGFLEGLWNPEFLEEGQDPRKSWTTCNMNVLTKNTGYYNPEFGTYTLRGINVKIEKATRPDGVWYEPSDFAPWLPQPSENTGGGAA